MPTAAANAWVTRVLGITLAPVAPPPPARAARPLPTRARPRLPPRPAFVSVAGLRRWQDATQDAEAQVALLADHLDDTGDPTLEQIARRSVSEVTRRLKAELAAALSAVDAAPAAEQAAPRRKAQDVVSAYRQRLADDTLLGLLDANPYRVPVSIRRTLEAALDEISGSLAQPGAAR